MFCKKCGNNLADDSVFCAKCGTKVEELKQEPQQVVVQEVVPAEMPQPVPQQVVAQELPPVAPTEIPQPIPQQTTYRQKVTNNNEFSDEVAVAIKKYNRNKKIVFVLLTITIILAIVTIIQNNILFAQAGITASGSTFTFLVIRNVVKRIILFVAIAYILMDNMGEQAKKMPETMLTKGKRMLIVMRNRGKFFGILILAVLFFFALF